MNRQILPLRDYLKDSDVCLAGALQKPTAGKIRISANLHSLYQCDVVYSVNLYLLINELSKNPGRFPHLKYVVSTARSTSIKKRKTYFAHVQIPVESAWRYDYFPAYNATTGIVAAKHLLTYPIKSLEIVGMDLYGSREWAGAHPMRPQARDWLEMEQKDARLDLGERLRNACLKLLSSPEQPRPS